MDEIDFRAVKGLVGLYFIYLVDQRISYPFRPSRVIYIGMSESKSNSIGNRLRDHKSGQSGNPGLTNYISIGATRFTYLDYEFLNVLGEYGVLQLEGIFLRNFCDSHGSQPICNNQAGIELASAAPSIHVEIDWGYFN